MEKPDHVEKQERPLENQLDAELMSSLIQTDLYRIQLSSLLMNRVLERLKTVPGFPVDLNEDSVRFDLTGKGAVVISVPVYKMEHEEALALKGRFEQLPGVTVKPVELRDRFEELCGVTAKPKPKSEGGFVKMHSLTVTVRFDRESIPDSPPAVEQTQEEARESFIRVGRQLP